MEKTKKKIKKPYQHFFDSELVKRSMRNPEFKKGVKKELFILEMAEPMLYGGDIGRSGECGGRRAVKGRVRRQQQA
jgi:hypothetical protein